MYYRSIFFSTVTFLGLKLSISRAWEFVIISVQHVPWLVNSIWCPIAKRKPWWDTGNFFFWVGSQTCHGPSHWKVRLPGNYTWPEKGRQWPAGPDNALTLGPEICQTFPLLLLQHLCCLGLWDQLLHNNCLLVLPLELLHVDWVHLLWSHV